MTKRRSDAEYAEMAKEFEAGRFWAAGPPIVGAGANLQMKDGRPVGQTAAGSTPDDDAETS